VLPGARVNQWHLAWLGLVAGVGGSALDSLLGGAVQATFLHVASGRVCCELPHGATLLRDAASVAAATQASVTAGARVEGAGAGVATSSGTSNPSGGPVKRRAGMGDDGAGDRGGVADDVYVPVAGGGAAWLSNEGVNLASAAVTAAVAVVAWGV
jgi:hypothetical protein